MRRFQGKSFSAVRTSKHLRGLGQCWLDQGYWAGMTYEDEGVWMSLKRSSFLRGLSYRSTNPLMHYYAVEEPDACLMDAMTRMGGSPATKLLAIRLGLEVSDG